MAPERISPPSTVPAEPNSRKRASPSEDGVSPTQPTSKRRRCNDASVAQTPPPEEEDSFSWGPAKVLMSHDDPKQLLTRSIGLALEHVGFHAASVQALDRLCNQVEEYAMTFLSKVTSNMLNSRRALPIPLDFEYALHEFALPMESLKPHLRPPMTIPPVRMEKEPPPPTNLSTASLVTLLGPELAGETEKIQKPFIPSRFPSFPSKHTYKFTEPEDPRIKDKREIRELAAGESRTSEGLLRNFKRVEGASKVIAMKERADKDPKSRERYEVITEVIKENKSQDDDGAMVVNANRKYMRQGVTRKRPGQALQAEAAALLS